MYWALTGKNVPTLIPKKTKIGLLAQTEQEFRTPHEIYQKIPKHVSEIVMDCVQKRPADRPSNMAEIISRMDVIIREIFGNKIAGNGSSK